MKWKITAGILVGIAVLLLPPLGLHWWRGRGEWFPMKVGDRWTYVDPAIPHKVVFDVVGREAGGAFTVDRRIGSERTTFVVSVSPDSVFILGTSKGAFEPPFEEFRLPPVPGMKWTYRGEFRGRPMTVRSEVEASRGPRRVVKEDGPHGWTRFELERGRGVVKLEGKGADPHGFGQRRFDWTLESFERRG
jgi:hypothetical protein